MALIMRYTTIIILVFSMVCPVLSQKYEFFDVNDGLSSSYVSSIIQDSEGYIWIATEDGLNRFDGSRFMVYRNIPNDTTSLISNHITTVYEDSKHRFWVATLSGLCLYDKVTGRFYPYKVPHSDDGKEITQFYFLLEDHKGYIWACISGNGVVRIDVSKEEFIYFNTKNSAICSDHINVIYEDRFGNIWFGSGQDGLSIYNPSNGTFRTFRYHPENKNGISSNDISSICEDMDGNVWVGTLTGGVNIYSFANQSFQMFDYDSRKIAYLERDSKRNIWIGTMGSGFDIYSTTQKKLLEKKIQSPLVDLSDTKIQTLFEDKQGNVWIGLFQKGVFMVPETSSLFTNYAYNPFSRKETIGEGAVQPVFMDSYQNLWVGVDGKGVYRLNKEMDIIKHYGQEDGSGLFNNVALTVFEDSKRHIWFGTFLNGAIRYNPSINQFDVSLTKDSPPYGLLSSHIKDFEEDAAGNLWIATSGGGVNIYNPKDKTFEYLLRDDSKADDNQLVDNYCSMICIDHDSIFWIATFRGLCSYNREKKQFTHYTQKNNKLPNDVVTYLKEDSNGNLWIGTQNGLACLDSNREQITFFNINDGLPNSIINGIEEDLDGNIWIVTNDGLSMYNPQQHKFINYTTADGLYTNEFTRNAIVKTVDGEFIIGSMKGLTSFFPAKLRNEEVKPLNLLFTNLYIFNEKVDIGYSPGHVLTKAIDYSDKITLTHAQNSFSVEFTAIEYLTPEKVNYEVMMEGFDKQWRTAKNKMVTYTNLNPGDYTLVVRAWMNDKEHALVRKLQIKTLPPLWGTVWAKMLYIILAMIIGYFAYRYINDRLSAKRQEQLMQEKLQFFTDISHEIRTPLTLILSPLSKLMNKNTDISLGQTYHTMYKNGVRLLQLVNQVMDLRAVEFGKKKLFTEETNITIFVRDLKNSFNNLAEEKNLTYTFTSEPEEISGFIDVDIISKVLFNIISNAFKFTDNGSVSVALTVNDKNKLAITVSDTGKGIPSNQQEQIFERFVTIGMSERMNSSGIGLHLTSKLVKLHHGVIRLESKEGAGSCFSIILPYLKENYTEEERTDHTGLSSLYALKTYLPMEDNKNEEKVKTNTNFRHSILIVDDNADIRQLISAEFSNVYRILEASNGKDALRIAIEKKPTLIISDVIMPEMDGIEFCEKIRNNSQTSDIPFIMLTARSSIEHQIEGLERGADAYVAKPFNIVYLKARIERLIESREKLKKKYSADILIEEKPIVVAESQDDKLLKKINELIEDRLDDTDLSVDILCKELGLSRTHLNRKMKELTGESPATYIRQLRLNKSARLLKGRSFTISEIAFVVGFSSPSYFSQAFRDYYGMTPKEFMDMEEPRKQ